MSETQENGRVKELWQSQATEGVRMSVEQIRMEAGRFERRIQWRNSREYLGALFAILCFGWMSTRMHGALLRTGFALGIAGSCYVVWHLLTKGSPAMSPDAFGADIGRASWIEFRKTELMRQRDLLSSIWRWYLGPLIPGIAVVFLAAARAAHANRHALAIWVADGLFVFAVFVGIGWLNKLGARKLQQKIDELDAQSRD